MAPTIEQEICQAAAMVFIDENEWTDWDAETVAAVSALIQKQRAAARRETVETCCAAVKRIADKNDAMAAEAAVMVCNYIRAAFPPDAKPEDKDDDRDGALEEKTIARLVHYMRVKLKANRHKTNWRGQSPDYLIGRVFIETNELKMASDTNATPETVWLEAADVANLAMMVADCIEAAEAAPANGTTTEHQQALADADHDNRALADALTRGQWDVIGAPPSETWEKMRESCHATFNGGHHDPKCHDAFHHGMDTVFNCLQGGGFKEMNECKKGASNAQQRLNAAAVELADYRGCEIDRLRKNVEGCECNSCSILRLARELGIVTEQKP